MTKPKPSMLCAMSALLALTAIPLRASDAVGIYCLVEKIVLEPNDTEPQRIQIWGAFALSDGKSGDGYTVPQRGYLYYECPQRQDAACQSEWADFKAAAGKEQGLGFGGRYRPTGRLRKADEKPASPDPYPIQMGVVRMGNYYTHAGILAQLRGALGRK